MHTSRDKSDRANVTTTEARAARQLILDRADREPSLSELTWIPGARPAVDALLRQGHVLLADTTNPGSPLALDDALVRVADDASWMPRAQGDRRTGYIVILTESGGAEYRVFATRLDAA
jgi:hypothetical protein